MAIVVEYHLLFEFLFSFVLVFVHDESDFEGIDGEEVVVLFDNIYDLVFFEVREEVHDEFFVVLEDHYAELLEHVS